MPAVKAFLFDLDGLLADTEKIHMLAFAETATRLGHKSEPKDYLSWIGHSSLDLGNWLAPRCGNTHTGQEIMDLEQQAFLEILLREQPKPFSGAQDFFDTGDALGFQRALVSNTHYTLATAVLKVLLPHMNRSAEPESHFKHFATGDRVPKLKPSPAPYLSAAEKLGVSPGECIAFEDSPAGATSAREAGCFVVAIPNIYLDPAAINKIANVSFKTLKDAHTAKVWER